MSADLLAEFGQGSGPAQSCPGRSQAQPQTNSSIVDLGQPDEFFFAGESANALSSQPANPIIQKKPSFQTFELPQRHDSDVLFDATLDPPASDTDDEWGEFEGPESSVPPSHSQGPAPTQAKNPPTTQPRPHQSQGVSGTVDLLDSLSVKDPDPVPKKSSQWPSKSNHQSQPSHPPNDPAWDEDSFGDWGEFTDEAPSNPTPTKSLPKVQAKAQQRPVQPTPAQPTWEDDEDWGDFDDGPSPSPALPKPKHKPSPSTTSSSSNIIPGASSSSSPTIVRPTNIPPPSVLLELLVDIFNNLQKEAAKAKARDAPQSTRTSTASSIRNTLETAARIIAGRTLRWKRDTILSQSMRIGPARAGKSNGMKLSAVNKHEDVKEKQDAVDVLSLWRERAALFNTVVQAAGRRPVPAVADPSALKVITARAESGALKASHACALCALKRDERVLKVDDENVQDSFGEWWTEHWGHTACREFWEANRGLLGQR